MTNEIEGFKRGEPLTSFFSLINGVCAAERRSRLSCWVMFYTARLGKEVCAEGGSVRRSEVRMPNESNGEEE